MEWRALPREETRGDDDHPDCKEDRRRIGRWEADGGNDAGSPSVVATSPSGLAALGGYYFTIADRYVYLLDVSTGRWLLPIVKTERQSRAVLAQIRRLGGPVPDGKRLVIDGDAFVNSVAREFRGLPVVLAVNFTSSGEVISHQTVTWDSSPASDLVKARAEQTLYQWRRDDARAAA
jgi:hypothetical protein